MGAVKGNRIARCSNSGVGLRGLTTHGTSGDWILVEKSRVPQGGSNPKDEWWQTLLVIEVEINVEIEILSRDVAASK